MFKKVDTKFSLAIILSCLLVLIIQAAVLLRTTNEMLNDDIVTLISSTAQEKSNLIEQKISRAVGIADDISSIVQGIVDPALLNEKGEEYQATIDPVIKKIVEDNIEQVMGAYLILDPTNTDKTFGVYYEDVNNTGTLAPKELYDIELFRTNSPRVQWYYDCVDKKDGVWYEPYFSEHNQLEMISFTKPIYKGDTYIGLLSIDLNFQVIKDFVNGFELFNSGYVFVVNEAGHFVVHKTLTAEDSMDTAEGGEFARLQEDISKNTTLASTYEIDGQKKHLSFAKLSNGWAVCSVVGEDSLIANRNKMNTITATVIIFAILISIVFSKLFCFNIVRAITYVTNSLKRMGDLDIGINEKDKEFEKKFKGNDQISTMVTSLGSLRTHLNHIIPKLQEESNDTFEHSGNLSQLIQKSTASMVDITSVMQNISQNSSNQVNQAKSGVTNLNNLSERIEESGSYTKNVKNCLEKTQGQNNENRNNLDNLLGKFTVTKENTQEVSVSIHSLSDKSKDIEQIVTAIKKIAHQTNILSLNASVEAARAGVTGKGFSVVAGEIKELSYKTTSSANEIEVIVKDIISDITLVSNKLQNSETALSESSVAMEDTTKSFKQIAGDIDEMAKATELLLGNINQISRDKEEVVQLIHSILNMSTQNGEDVDLVTPKIIEENQVLGKMDKIGNQLKELAESLDVITKSFRTSK